MAAQTQLNDRKKPKAATRQEKTPQKDQQMWTQYVTADSGTSKQ